MGQYNPNATNTAGLEWPAIRQLDTQFGAGYTSGAAAIFDCTSTQTVDKMKAYLTLPGHFDSDPSRTGIIADIYNANDFDGGPVQVAVSVPVQDVATLANGQLATAPILRSDNGTGTNKFQMVDEHPATFTVPAHPWNPQSDGLRATYPQTGDADTNPQIGLLAFRCSTQFQDKTTQAGVSLIGKRIIDVRIGVWYAGLAGGSAYTAHLLGYLSDGTSVIEMNDINTGAWLSVPNDSKIRSGTLSCFGAPYGLSPQWRKADLDKLLLGGTGYIELRLDGIRPGSQGMAIYAAWLEVTYANEKRIATSHKRATSSATPRWEQLDFLDPITHNALTWTKTAGNTYMIVTRLGDWPGTGGGTVGTHSWRKLDIFPQNNAGAGGTLGGSFNVIQPADPLPGQSTAMVPFTSPATAGLVGGRAGLPSPPTGSDVITLDDLNPVATAAQSYYLMAGATVRADSQPYVLCRPTLMNQNRVYQQELTSGITNGGYGVVRMLILNDTVLHKADADLNVRVKVRTTNVVLQQAILARTEMPPADGKWYLVTKRLTTMTLAAGTQYLLEFQTAASAPNGWTIQVLDAAGVEGAADGYGGTADAATLNGPEFTDRDVVATLALIPAAPGNTTAAVAQYDTSRQLVAASTCPGGGCIVPAVDFAQLTWAESTLVGFARYEIDRYDDGTWRRIASIGDSKAIAFGDFEVRRNVDSAWRIRQIRLDGVDSDWVIIGILHVPADENEVVLASNDAPTNVLGLYDDPGFTWNRIASERAVEKVLYGRNKVLVFKEAEDRGERFTRRFIMAFRSPAVRTNWPLGGRAMFDPIVELCEDPTLPHVTLCDWRGRRWYTSPVIASLNEETNARYIAEVAFTEVAGPTPAVVSFLGGTQPPPGQGAYPGGYQEGY